jgi:hypothetical protein
MIYQFKISLKNIKPLIWRKVQINPEETLYMLHHVIQVAMDWENYHLYEFSAGSTRFGNQDLLEDDDVIDDKEVLLKDLFTEEGQALDYLYDFGDSWRHVIKLEKIIQLGEADVPKCTGGKNCAPPEDCGGVPDFYEFIRIMSVRKGAGYKEYKKWYGGDFDPEFINLHEINETLSDMEEYMSEYDG